MAQLTKRSWFLLFWEWLCWEENRLCAVVCGCVFHRSSPKTSLHTHPYQSLLVPSQHVYRVRKNTVGMSPWSTVGTIRGPFWGLGHLLSCPRSLKSSPGAATSPPPLCTLIQRLKPDCTCLFSCFLFLFFCFLLMCISKYINIIAYIVFHINSDYPFNIILQYLTWFEYIWAMLW